MEISKKTLLSPKDHNIELFLAEFLDHIETVFSENPTISQNDKLTYIHEKLSEYSVLLSHKLFPIIKSYFDVKYNKGLNDTFAVITAPSLDDAIISAKYRRCFESFINANDCINFVTLNTNLLGQIDIKDMFILSFYAFVTSRRQENDNILMLLLTGASSSGKSTLFENVLRETSHSLATEEGVGRFKVGRTNCLMLNDCDLKTLYASRDKDRLKSLCRTEIVQAKVHSSVCTVPATFIFVTSNQKLNKHTFKSDNKSSVFQKVYESDVVFNSLLEEHVTAIRMRFIECFVRKRPRICEQDLLQCGNFNRRHFICGLQSLMVSILNKYNREDYASPYTFLYVISAMCKNAPLLAGDANYYSDVKHLVEKYNLTDIEKEQLNLNLTSNYGNTLGQGGAHSPSQ